MVFDGTIAEFKQQDTNIAARFRELTKAG